MNYRANPGGGFFSDIPPVVRQLLLINTIIFLGEQILSPEMRMQFHVLGALTPELVFRGMIWQPFTYMFMHGDFMHLLFNMFGLYFFGRELEYYWGSGAFLRYYLTCGVGAGLIHLAVSVMQGNMSGGMIGASGAVFGIFIAYAIYFPNREVYIWALFPIRARTLVVVLIVMQFVLMPLGDGIARWAHLGGALTGFLYLRRNQLVWKAKQFMARRVAHTPRKPSHRDPVMSSEEEAKRKVEIDRVLAKISQEGMGSLTAEERRILEESAKRARNRQEGKNS